MKTILKCLALATAFGGILPQLRADGYIVPSGIVSNYGGLFSPYEISVLHDPDHPNVPSSYTGFLFFPRSGNTFQFDHVVDVGVRVFFVSPNDPISLGSIQAQTYTELMNPNQYMFNPGASFYVGLYTGNDPSNPLPGGIYNNPLFGWARLRNVNGTIQILDSALEYQGGGIFAGTQNIIPVPEPSSIALVILGAGVIGFFRWRKALPK